MSVSASRSQANNVSQPGMQDLSSQSPLDSHVFFVGITTQGRVLRPLELALDTDSQAISRGIISTLRKFLDKVPYVSQHLHHLIQLHPRVILLDL